MWIIAKVSVLGMSRSLLTTRHSPARSSFSACVRLLLTFQHMARNITKLIDLRYEFSYGTAKSGVGISAMAVLRPDLMMKNVVPVIMAGIIAVRPPPLPLPSI